MSAKIQISQAPGLVTAPGSALVGGALLRAAGIMSRRQGIYEQRRGLTQMNVASHPWSSSALMPAIFQYQGVLYAWTSTSYSGSTQLTPCVATLWRLVGNTWTSVLTNVNISQSMPLLDYQRTAEAQKNLYFPTQSGLYFATDNSSAPQKAGISRGREMLLTPVTAPTGVTTFLNVIGDSVMYAICYTQTDANGYVARGAPSGYFTFTNAAANVYVNIQSWLPLHYGDSYEVYRSNVVLTGTTPTTELQLVWRAQLTATDIANGYVQFTDLQPDGLKGQLLYTNPSQQGISQENDYPPACWDIVYFKNTMWYFNLSVPDGVGKSPDRTALVIQTLGIPQVYVLNGAGGQVQAATPIAGQATYTFTSAAGFTYDFDNLAGNTNLSVIGCTNAGNNGDFTIVSVNTGARQIVVTNGGAVNEAAPPGTAKAVAAALIVTSVSEGSLTFKASLNTESVGSGLYKVQTSGTDPANVSATMASFVRVLNQHTFSSAPIVATDISDPTLAPGELLFERLASEVFSIQAVGRPAGSTSSGQVTYANKFAPALANAQSSQGSVNNNGILFSKVGDNPIHVPQSGQNTILVGSTIEPILRGIHLRDTLFVFKTDGLYRIDDAGSGTWQLSVYDVTVKLLHRNLICVLQDAIYAMTNRGVVRITDSGREFISSPIDDLISASLEENVAQSIYPSHMVASEIDGLVYIYFAAKVNPNSSTLRTYQFIYSSKTGIWTGDTDSTYSPGFSVDSNMMSLPGLQLRQVGSSQFAKITRHGFDYQSFALDLGDLYQEAVLTEAEPPSALSWENKLPLPGDRFILQCTAWDGTTFTGTPIGPYMGLGTIASQVQGSWMLGGISAHGALYNYYIYLLGQPVGTNPVFAITQPQVIPPIQSGTDAAAGFTPGQRYYLVAPVPVVVKAQPFGNATGFVAKQVPYVGQLLGDWATATPSEFSWLLWNELMGQGSALSSTALGTAPLDLTLRVDVPPTISRANRLSLQMSHATAGHFAPLLGFVYEIAETEGEES